LNGLPKIKGEILPVFDLPKGGFRKLSRKGIDFLHERRSFLNEFQGGVFMIVGGISLLAASLSQHLCI
jgi:hypothetical protein